VTSRDSEPAGFSFGAAPPPGPPDAQDAEDEHRTAAGRPWHNDDLAWAAGAHLGGVVVSFVAPLFVLLVRGRESRFLRDQAIEATNFQLTLIGGPFALLLGVALAAHVLPGLITLVLVILLILSLPILMIYGLVQAIRAGLAAGRGEAYCYPWTVRLLK
jgi:uncharacterized Tic20 family protein